MTSNIPLLQIQTPTQTGTCKDIVPQEQACHIERCVTNRSTDKPKGDTPDKPSHLWPLGSVQCLNDGQTTNLAKPLEYKYTKCREANDISCAYRPTSIDSRPQHPVHFQPHYPHFTPPHHLWYRTATHTHFPGSRTHRRRRYASRCRWKVHHEPTGACLCAASGGPNDSRGPARSGRSAQSGRPARYVSLSLEHCIGTVSDPFG